MRFDLWDLIIFSIVGGLLLTTVVNNVDEKHQAYQRKTCWEKGGVLVEIPNGQWACLKIEQENLI